MKARPFNFGILLRAGYLLLLSLLFLPGSTRFAFVHDFTAHSHDSVQHTFDQESDACHRTIYHGDIDKGCGHSSHFVNSDKCALCDITVPPGAELLSAIRWQADRSGTTYHPQLLTSGVSHFPNKGSSRAPPLA